MRAKYQFLLNTGMKLSHLFELSPPKDGMRQATETETSKAILYARRCGIELGSVKIDDATGDYYIAGPDKQGRSVTIRISKTGQRL